MKHCKIALAALGIAASALPGTAAHACDTVDNMYSISLLEGTTGDTLPDGITQLKITISEHVYKANAKQQEYFHAHIVDDKSPEKRPKTITILLPSMTSCGGFSLPEPGEYLVSGAFAKGYANKPVYIGGRMLFVPQTKTTRQGPRKQLEAME